jgi:hypothetical protein
MDHDPSGIIIDKVYDILKDTEVSELAIALDAMAATLDMDTTLTDACKADVLTSHDLGLPITDKKNAAYVTKEIAFLARDLPKRYKELIEGKTWDRFEKPKQQMSRRSQRKFQKSLSRSAGIQDTYADAMQDIAERERLGLYDSSLIDYVYFVDNIHYFFDPRPDDDDIPLRMDLIDKEDLKPMFTDEEIQEGIMMGQLAQKQLDRGMIDPSEETLHARFDHVTKAVQIEMLYATLFILDTLGSRGGKKRIFAASFLQSHDEVARQDDLWGSVEMMAELEKACRTYAASEKSTTIKQLSGIARRYIDDVKHLVGAYKEVYEAYGYDPHDAIKAIPSASRTLGTQAVAHVAIVDRKKDTAESLSQATELQSSLSELVAELTKQWRLSTKERKARDFGAFHKTLVNGYRNALGDLIIPGLPKGRVQELTDALNFLEQSTTSEGAEQTLERLGYLQELETEINSEARRLSRLVVAERLPSSLTLQPYSSLTENVFYIRDHWDVYKKLINDTWPRAGGAHAITVIEPLLFPPEREGEAIEIEDQPAIEALPTPADLFEAFAGSTAIEQLDILLLPPSASEQDIQQELQRLGATPEAVNEVEWQRLFDLLAVRDRFSGAIYRSKDRLLESTPPYYVAVIEIDGSRYAVADSPVLGNATYVVSERHAPGSWLEMLELSKEEIRELGARRIIHSKTAPHGPIHQGKIYNTIFDLHTTKGL